MSRLPHTYCSWQVTAIFLASRNMIAVENAHSYFYRQMVLVKLEVRSSCESRRGKESEPSVAGNIYMHLVHHKTLWFMIIARVVVRQMTV